jgi:DtxR family transcriptional regulator, Mn-dependent transcriptional regulator
LAEPSHSAPEYPAGHRRRPVDTDPPCADVSGREAGYLLALHQLASATKPPTQKGLAESMGVAAPTALEMVRRLRRMSLVEADRLELTPKGTSAALLLASRRHAAHLLTGDVLGYADAATNPEAARLAPSLSRELARKLLAVRPPRES